MAKAERELRVHQVKISLRLQDATEVASCARNEGVGSGPFIRSLTLRHLAGLTKARQVQRTSSSSVARDSDRMKFGSHISVWFTNEEHASLMRFGIERGLTVSGYIGRCVVERWLSARRQRLGTVAGAKTGLALSVLLTGHCFVYQTWDMPWQVCTSFL